MNDLTIVQLQTHVHSDKMKNIEMLPPLLSQASAQKADFVCLPEMFACPYETANFPKYAEKIRAPRGLPSLLWRRSSISTCPPALCRNSQTMEVSITLPTFSTARAIRLPNTVRSICLILTSGEASTLKNLTPYLPVRPVRSLTQNLEKLGSASAMISVFRSWQGEWFSKVHRSFLFQPPLI